MQQTFISNPQDITAAHYVALLEKTNEQLSLWSNPYGVLVGVLSFLFTTLTIVFAYILWKQSKEQKDAISSLFTTALNNYEVSLQENLKTIGTNAEQKIDQFIIEKNKEISKLSGNVKVQAEKIIKDLKKEKEIIGTRVQFDTINDNLVTHAGTKSYYSGTMISPSPSFVSTAGNISSGIGFASPSPSSAYIVNNKLCGNCGWYNSGLSGISTFCSHCGNKL